MTVTISLPQFEGPFEVLLGLIEDQKMPITDVTLSHVTDQYFAYLKSHSEIPLFELADFLYVASRLLHLKSKELVSDSSAEEEEAGPPLEYRLRMYKTYAHATRHITACIQQGNVAFFGKLKAPPLSSGFYPPRSCTAGQLAGFMRALLDRLEPLLALPRVRIEKVISINEKITLIKDKIMRALRLRFHDIADRGSASDVIVSFLALLELIKTQHITVTQNALFEDLTLSVYESHRSN